MCTIGNSGDGELQGQLLVRRQRLRALRQHGVGVVRAREANLTFRKEFRISIIRSQEPWAKRQQKSTLSQTSKRKIPCNKEGNPNQKISKRVNERPTHFKAQGKGRGLRDAWRAGQPRAGAVDMLFVNICESGSDSIQHQRY